MIDWIVIGIALSGTLLGTARAAVLGRRWLPALHAALTALLAFSLLPLLTSLPSEQLVAFTSSALALNVVGGVLVVEALVLVLIAPGLIASGREGRRTLKGALAALAPSPGALLGLALLSSLAMRNNHSLEFGTVAALVSIAGFLFLATLSYGVRLVIRSSEQREGLLLLAALFQLLAGTFLPVLVASALPTTAFLQPELAPTAAVLVATAALIGLGSRLPRWRQRKTRA